MPVVDVPALVICDDVGRAPAPLCLEGLAGRLRRELPGAVVVTVAGLCASPEAVSGALAGTGRKRLVLGCRNGSEKRGDLLAAMRRAGLAAGAVDIVDLRPAAASGGRVVDEPTVFEQSVALLLASAALVSAADLEVPTPARTSLCSGKISRRSLLRGANVVRQPVAVWQAGHCEGRAGCTACVLACPEGALSRESGRLVVSAELCTACGACVSACRSGAFALAGARLEALAAAAGVLVENVARGVGATGIAIACRHSRSAPRPGERWLALRVPSLKMVTAGWLLSLVSAGVETRVVACEDDSCEARGGDLGDFLVALHEALGRAPAPCGLSSVLRRVAADRDQVIELREPEATMRSLEALGYLRDGGRAWRADGAGCPLGEMRIDPVACSFCEVCAGACPTGALAARHDESGSLSLSFDPGCCTACGACQACCPERALDTVRGMDGASLAAGRRILASRPALASCASCGAPLDAGLSAAALSRATSRDTIGPVTARICPDCRLGGRTVRSRRTG